MPTLRHPILFSSAVVSRLERRHIKGRKQIMPLGGIIAKSLILSGTYYTLQRSVEAIMDVDGGNLRSWQLHVDYDSFR